MIRWRAPLTVLLVVLAAAALVGNALVATPATGSDPVDFSVFDGPGAAILEGRWGAVYADPIIQAGPFELAFWGVPALLGVSGYVGWAVFGVAVGLLVVVALGVVTAWIVRPLLPTWWLQVALGVAAVAALSGLPTSATSNGHPSEAIVPLLWLVAGMLARRSHPAWAAAVLAATTGWELWGILAVPVLLLTPRIRLRTVLVAAAAGIVVLAALFLPFALAGPFRMFGFRWPVYPDTLAHLLFPHATTFSWPLRAAQGVLAVGAGVVTAVLLRRRLDAVWLVPLVVCVVRLVADPVLAGYYAVPPFILLLVGAALAAAQRSWIVLALTLVTVNVLVDVRLTLGSAAVLVALTAAIAVLLVVRDRRRVRERRMPAR